jgi:hypothetical protein
MEEKIGVRKNDQRIGWLKGITRKFIPTQISVS